MRTLYTILSLAPAPLFFAGFLWSLLAPSTHCGQDWQMPAMWFVMSMAHAFPWVLRAQQHYLTRN